MYALHDLNRHQLMVFADNDEGVQVGHAGGAFVAHGKG